MKKYYLGAFKDINSLIYEDLWLLHELIYL